MAWVRSVVIFAALSAAQAAGAAAPTLPADALPEAGGLSCAALKTWLERSAAQRPGLDQAIRIRTAAELDGEARDSLVGRHAAALQREYEAVVGKPAQSVTLRPTEVDGVSRWSASWVDANFAGAAHGLTIEAFIIAADPGCTLEMTLAAPADQALPGALASLQPAPTAAVRAHR